jgi:hypothetical protein
MLFIGDHLLLAIVIILAISLYGLEMLFFWFKWQTLSGRLASEERLAPSVFDLQAEVEVLSEELAFLRRQFVSQGKREPFSSEDRTMIEEPFLASSLTPSGTTKKMEEEKKSASRPLFKSREVQHPPIAAQAPTPPIPNPLRSYVGRSATTHTASPERETIQQRKEREETPFYPPRMPSIAESHPAELGGASSSFGASFSRGVSMMHRRVVELARNGMDAATIATECQLSQSETELILSLNGVR